MLETVMNNPILTRIYDFEKASSVLHEEANKLKRELLLQAGWVDDSLRGYKSPLTGVSHILYDAFELYKKNI